MLGSLCLFLTFATIVYLAIFDPGWYLVLAALCDRFWQSLVSWTIALTGNDMWVMRVLAGVSLVIKGGSAILIMLIWIGWRILLHLLFRRKIGRGIPR
jgi:hypothetical protein